MLLQAAFSASLFGCSNSSPFVLVRLRLGLVDSYRLVIGTFFAVKVTKRCTVWPSRAYTLSNLIPKYKYQDL